MTGMEKFSLFSIDTPQYLRRPLIKTALKYCCLVNLYGLVIVADKVVNLAIRFFNALWREILQLLVVCNKTVTLTKSLWTCYIQFSLILNFSKFIDNISANAFSYLLL